jgi:uncharacterized protein YndB with AHSA1/START domain
MNTEDPATFGKLKRKMDKVNRDGREAWRLTCVRLYETEVDDAWDALTNPERIPRWFLPISGDLKLGGRFQFKGNAGGVIETCDAPRTLGVTWEMHGGTSWVTVTLESQNGNTVFTLEHVAHVPEDLFDQFGPGAVGVGWDLALLKGLAIHFETNAPVDPDAAELWVLSPEGRTFVEGCSQGWAEASIRAGTERAQAEAAAKRVTDFYSPPSAT